MSGARYISCADSAKLLRKALKSNFPGVRFSVKSRVYAGGASIDIHWLDGPTRKQVESVSRHFQSADFDGMIDMESGRDQWLTPQGEVYVARIDGTEGSAGTIATRTFIRPHDDAERVHLGSKYVFAERECTEEMYNTVAAEVSKKYNVRLQVKEFASGYYAFEAEPGDQWIADIARRELAERVGPNHSDRSR